MRNANCETRTDYLSLTSDFWPPTLLFSLPGQHHPVSHGQADIFNSPVAGKRKRGSTLTAPPARWVTGLAEDGAGGSVALSASASTAADDVP